MLTPAEKQVLLQGARGLPTQTAGQSVSSSHVSLRVNDEWVELDWLEAIDAVLDTAATSLPMTSPANAEAEDDGFYKLFAKVAHQRLLSSLASQAPVHELSAEAHESLLKHLIHALQFVFQSALEAEHKRSVASNSPAVTDGMHHANGVLPTTLLHPTRLTEFLLAYSAATRAAGVLMCRWHYNILEWVHRLTVDAAAIAQRFLGEKAMLGAVAQIDPGLSDPHHGGKSVMRLHFSSGLRLIYKPRSVGLDVAYRQFLTWLEAQGAPHPLRTPMHLARPRYAWVEHIDHEPCRSFEALLRFCETAGALLCVSHVLGANDLHDGNVIATAHGPVPIDLETLLHPYPLTTPSATQGTTPPTTNAMHKAMWWADRSVLRTGLLPALNAGPDGSVADVGCFGSLFEGYSSSWYDHEHLASPLSDELRQTLHRRSSDGQEGDERGHLRRCGDRIGDGFAATYRFLMAHRDRLLDKHSPLNAFKHQMVRFVWRDTRVYFNLLRFSFSAQHVREGSRRSMVLHALHRLPLKYPRSKAVQQVIDAEIAALEALDIPLLHTTTQSTVWVPDAVSDDAQATETNRLGPQQTPSPLSQPLFEQASYEAMRERLQALSEADLHRQLAWIAGTFAARRINARLLQHGQGVGRSEAGCALQPQTVHDMVMALRDQAITGEDGSVTWMAPVPIAGTPHFRFDVLPVGRAFGLVGVAFFLAACHWTHQDEAAAKLAKQALQTVVYQLGLLGLHMNDDGSSPPSSSRHTVMTGTTGMTGTEGAAVLYSLHYCGVWLHDLGLQAAVQRWALQLSNPSVHHTQTTWAFQHMAAGADWCLALLVIGHAKRAVWWGQQCLQHWHCWQTAEREQVVHQAPNLALCWYRLYEMTGCPDFQTAHQEASSYTKQAMMKEPTAIGVPPCPTQVGMPQMPEMPQEVFFPSFEHGFTGIGYALLRTQGRQDLPCVELWH